MAEKKSDKKTSTKTKITKAQPNKSSKSKVIKLTIPNDSFYGTGKRKTSIARVWVFPGKGNVVINQKPIDEYFGRLVYQSMIRKPLESLNLSDKYDVKATVLGGGLTGQASALQLGVARALLDANETFRKNLKSDGLLTRDPRIKERKKYGRKRARKGYQFRKR